MMSFDQLKKELFERFIKACDEIDHLIEKKKLAVKTVYSTTSLYDLEKYENGNIQPGGVLTDTIPAQNPYVYGLDEQNRPCYSCFEHTWNKCFWEGFYNYSDTLAEYVEFSMESGKPNTIIRLHFENGRRKSLQYFKINGGGIGKTYAGLTNHEIVCKLQESKYDLLCRLELYHYEQERIISADCWSMIPGIGPDFYEQHYTYDGAGMLQEIREDSKDSASQYVYVEQPADMTLQELSDTVSLNIAQAIVEAIESVQFKSPLAIMQLNYLEVSNYDPYVTVITQQDQQKILDHTSKENLLNELFISMGQEIHVDTNKFDRLLTAFLNKVEEEHNYDLATDMIRKAANLLTTQKLFEAGKISDDFIAFSVDWSLIADDLPQMMQECGMTSNTLKKWQALGLFIPE